MKTQQNTPDDESRFDRLVDGALSAAEYKSLVSSLDDEPGGWRRCATAFLEAQAWGKEFSAIRRVEEDGPASSKSAGEIELRTDRKSLSLASSPLLAAAACALLAFGLGMVTRNGFYSSDSLPTKFAGQQPDGNHEAPMLAAEADPTEDSEIAAMRFVLDGDGNEEIEVPVIGGNHPGTQTLVETEPAIPDSVLRSLRMQGHDIRRQQEFIPVALGDGRQVIFPVEQYRITPVSSRSY
ncbi:MAG: hypothetical protein ACKVP0_14090 [Pirellulaceae bacterium]